jgi:hypothetical protein
MDTTTRIVNAWRQTDDEDLFRSAVMHILLDDRLPAYREQQDTIAQLEARVERLRAMVADDAGGSTMHPEVTATNNGPHFVRVECQDCERLRQALRVILTWADYEDEDEDGHRPAFDHAAVSALCRKALAAGRGEGE